MDEPLREDAKMIYYCDRCGRDMEVEVDIMPMALGRRIMHAEMSFEDLDSHKVDRVNLCFSCKVGIEKAIKNWWKNE